MPHFAFWTFSEFYISGVCRSGHSTKGHTQSCLINSDFGDKPVGFEQVFMLVLRLIWDRRKIRDTFVCFFILFWKRNLLYLISLKLVKREKRDQPWISIFSKMEQSWKFYSNKRALVCKPKLNGQEYYHWNLVHEHLVRMELVNRNDFQTSYLRSFVLMESGIELPNRRNLG